jgi:hypothetical protein
LLDDLNGIDGHETPVVHLIDARTSGEIVIMALVGVVY